MFDDNHGFYIQRLADGSVRLVKRVDAVPGSAILYETTLTPEQWARAVASVAQDCASCRAFFIAYSGHMGGDPPRVRVPFSGDEG